MRREKVTAGERQKKRKVDVKEYTNARILPNTRRRHSSESIFRQIILAKALHFSFNRDNISQMKQ